MCHVESNKKCDFVDIFEFFSTFWNLIHFWPCRFSLNFRKLLLKSIFIFCLVNWTYVPRWIEQKVWFCWYFWIFLYVLELSSFLVSQIFTILYKIVKFINIYNLPCNLDLCAKLNQTKSVILSTFLNFPPRSRTSFIFVPQIFPQLQKIDNYINIYILPCKLDLYAKFYLIKSVILSIFLNFPLRFGT